VTSPDLQHWTRLEDVTGDKHHEAPVDLYWKNKFRLFVDECLARNPLRMGRVSHHEEHAQTG
jgi:hypothetical protein